MLKRLAILAVIWTFAIPAMATQNHDSSDNNDQNSQKVMPPPSSIASNQTTTYYQQSADDKPKGWHKFIAWPEGITAWAIIFTLGAIVWQAKATSNSAKAAEKSAEAARANTLAMIRAQRAWLVIKVEVEDESDIIFRAVNVGQTPAHILSIHGNGMVVSPKGKFQIDWNTLNESLMSTPRSFLPPQAECPAAQPIKIALLQQANPTVFYGKIRYFDVLEPSPKTTHETTWRYWLPPRGSLPIPDPFDPEDNTWT